MLAAFKALLRRVLAARGISPRRLPRAVIERPEALLTPTLEHVVAHRMLHVPDFFFVQIGAFDGRSGDPLHELIVAHGWRGVLVEPQRRYFAELESTYGDRPGLSLRNVAVADRREKRQLYRIRDDVPGLPEWAPQTASFDRATILRHSEDIPGIEALLETEEVDCVMLDEILAEAPDGRIDLLQIDVEGFDHEIIRMLDFERFAPSIIRFEHKHLHAEDYEAALRRLIDNGYRIAFEGPDTLAYLE